jgi:hypothetical protein
MEKETTKNTAEEKGTQAAKEGSSLFDFCKSCCGKGVSEGQDHTWQEACKGVKGNESISQMMEMCFPQDKKDK